MSDEGCTVQSIRAGAEPSGLGFFGIPHGLNSGRSR